LGAPEVAWGIGKSFIKQKTRYKRAESILAMLVCIALEIDYGVSFVLNTPWDEIKSEVAILVFVFQISKSEVNRIPKST
jgi:hypothetical protein